MMAERTETAEQKLLKMIETSSASGDSIGDVVISKKTIHKKQSSLALLKVLNSVLIVAVFIVIGLIINEYKKGTDLLSQHFKFTVNEGAARQVLESESLIPTVQKLSFYLAPVKQRSIFQPYEVKVDKVVDVSDKNKTIASKISHLKLVGISWMDSIETASVMIEDTEKNMTYFLRREQKIGDISVKTIYADSVALGYENEEIMIHYDTSKQ